MTVSLFYKMQNNNNNNTKSKTSSSKKQRPRHQAGTLSAMGSDTSMSCVPANYAPAEEELSTEAAATTITTQPTTRNESIDEDSEYETDDLKQACVAPEPRVSASAGESEPSVQESPVSVGEISKDWQSCVDGEPTPGTGPPNPPPSLVSATSSAQNSDQNRVQPITPAVIVGMCVPVDSQCLQLSENVPVPSRTDVIARVSREELCPDAASLKDDEESDAFASGEDLDVDKRSEYSTADEGDCETQYRRKVEVKAQAAINEDEDSSPEGEDSSPEEVTSLNPTRTDATTQRDPCSPTYEILAADSEALKPVIVRQVSEDEEVRVTSDDEEMERNSPESCTFDNNCDEPEKGSDANADQFVIPTQESGNEAQATQHTSTSPTSKPTGPAPQQDRCDGATEPIRWSDEEDNKSGVIIQETAECVPVECQETKNHQLAQKKPWDDTPFSTKNSRWRSLPSLPIIESFDSAGSKAVCASPRDAQPLTSPYPTSRSAGQCATPMLPLQATANLQQVKEFRVRQAMSDALTLCEEELGPVALALAQLKEKVRKLNLPEIATQRRPVGSLLYTESRYLPPAPSLAVSSIVRTNPRMAPSATASGSLCLPAQQQIGWTHPGVTQRIGHDADCVCRYCGLQVGTPDASLSPVARMYILLAQSHRGAHQHEESATRQPSDRGNTTSDQRI